MATSEQVAAYLPLIERLARKLKGGQANAEYDDLRQEGMIVVWLALDKGIDPGPGIITRRMLDWHRRLLRHGDTVPYDEVMGRDMEFLAEESVYA